MHTHRNTINTLRIVFFLLSWAIGLYWSGQWAVNVNDGFRLGRISSPLPYRRDWESPAPSLLEKEEIFYALSQKYTYLGKGAQSFAFQSSDGLYVLKFFKLCHLSPFSWIDLTPLPLNFKKAKRRERWNKLQKTFLSYRNARFLYPERSGILLAHLNPTLDCYPSIQVQGSSGITHNLSLDQLPFILQRRAFPFLNQIKTLAKEDDLSTAKCYLKDLALCIANRLEKCIKNCDPAFEQNLGLCQGKVLEFDVGQHEFCKDVHWGKGFIEQYERETERVKLWLHLRQPELYDYFEKVCFEQTRLHSQDLQC